MHMASLAISRCAIQKSLSISSVDQNVSPTVFVRCLMMVSSCVGVKVMFQLHTVLVVAPTVHVTSTGVPLVKVVKTLFSAFDWLPNM